MTPPPTAPSAASDEDGGGRSLSVATSRAGLGSDGGRGGGLGEGSTWSIDGVAIDRFGEEDGKPTTQTAQQRRPSSSSVLVPPLPLGKPEVVSSSSAAVRRKNSFVAKLVASWQFAQRKRLRRQGKEGERERVFFFCSLSFYLNSLALFPLFLNFSLFTHARALSLSPLQKNTHE